MTAFFCSSSYAERHDRVDDIVVILLEGLDSLLPRHVRLGHDQLDVLGLQAGVVDLLAVVLFLLLLGLGLGSLALVVGVGVVVTGVLTVASGLGGSQLLGSGGLGLGVQVLNLGLTKNTGSIVS